MFKKFFVIFLFCFTVSPSYGDSCSLPVCEDFVGYMKDMKSRFYRNLPCSGVPGDVRAKFFLTSDGFIRDVTIEKSSSSKDADLACIDAIYSASPLLPPPPFREPLPPPPMGAVLPPDFFGSGIYRFTFTSNNKKPPQTTNRYEYLAIPKEILFRYAGLLTPSELDRASNRLLIHPESDVLDNARYQWAWFYKNRPHASKMEIIQRSKLITAVYLKKQPPKTTLDVFEAVKVAIPSTETGAQAPNLPALESWLRNNTRVLSADEGKFFQESGVSFLITFIGMDGRGAVWLNRGSSDADNFAALQILRRVMPLTRPPSDLPYERGLLVTLKGSELTIKLAPE